MKNGSQQIANIYKRILRIIFARLAPTFGDRTVAAIARNTLVQASKKHPIVVHLGVSQLGFDWQSFEDHLHEASQEQVATALEEFLDEFFEALSNLIGSLIMTKVFEEARGISEGGDENETG